MNWILSSLWNKPVWGTFVPLKIEDTYNESCCLSSKYVSSLSSFQMNRTRAEWRNPFDPHNPLTGNSPPCVWCQFDGAYNDENPSIWSLLHALTFNLDETITELQFQVLQSIPMWLRQHLSCDLCRSHIAEHLVGLGVPDSRRGVDWARFFWQAHNYINEQSEVTRCGSQNCNWGAFLNPSPDFTCAGAYRYAWFMTYQCAEGMWKL